MNSRSSGRGNGALREKSPRLSSQHNSRDHALPKHRGDIANGTHHGGRRHGRRGMRVKAEGESGRRGVDPLHFFKIVWKSTSYLSRAVNILWPFVPAAIAVYYVLPDQHILKFSLLYIAMIPCANLIGFAGQELARKMPHVLGVLTETTVASIVEIILFILLLVRGHRDGNYTLLLGAILGSILANMLLCLGTCFIASGVRRDDATFDETISEAGSGLLLTAGVGLAVPAIFQRSTSDLGMTTVEVDSKLISISRAVAILLLLSYALFVWFQTRTHHGLFTKMFEEDEERDHDRDRDARKAKLTLTECILALVISVGLVAIVAINLVNEIDPLIEETGLTDPFMGLILVPLVEKLAEHLTAIDEAWDNQMNFALIHCVGATLQTALLVTPLIVIISWGLQWDFSLDFQIFDMAMLLLSIITVGNFLRDQKSNYLEGFLCVTVYVAIAVAAFYNPGAHGALASESGSGGTAEHLVAKVVGSL